MVCTAGERWQRARTFWSKLPPPVAVAIAVTVGSRGKISRLNWFVAAPSSTSPSGILPLLCPERLLRRILHANIGPESRHHAGSGAAASGLDPAIRPEWRHGIMVLVLEMHEGSWRATQAAVQTLKFSSFKVQLAQRIADQPARCAVAPTTAQQLEEGGSMRLRSRATNTFFGHRDICVLLVKKG